MSHFSWSCTILTKMILWENGHKRWIGFYLEDVVWARYFVSAWFFLSLSLSHFTPSLSADSMQEKSTGALQVHPFFIWRLTTLASSSLDWDPVLSQKSIERGWKREWRKRGSERERRDGEREAERRRKGAWEERVYMQQYVRNEKKDGERKWDVEGNGK